MSLTLYLNRREWFQHLEVMEERYPDYVPVIKGNGYGFGNGYLADAALHKGKRSVCVGTVEEARELEQAGSFDEILILTPVLTELTYEDMADNRVFTVGSSAQLDHLIRSFESLCQGQPSIWGRNGEPFCLSVLIKCQSPMKRYGFPLEEAGRLRSLLTESTQSSSLRIQVKGFSIHFPQTGVSDGEKERLVADWIREAVEWKLPTPRLFISHVSSSLYAKLRKNHLEIQFAMRLGTELWLHDKSFFETKSTVLDVKSVQKGERFGYKQQPAKKSGTLVFVSGGTANGVGLEAPVATRSLKDRLKLTAFWLLSLVNRHLSPYTYQGKRTWFAEPPHMQTSVLLFPEGSKAPEVGEELPVTLRMTTAHFDQCVERESEEKTEEKISQSQVADRHLNALP
ncbi:alanine racemase [Salinithrix halophila]|uniref:Alanine racemase n=1 Tax=Salinithrix halophila TaxID=1485204 RepID=A0ABV8JJ35_9BACL